MPPLAVPAISTPFLPLPATDVAQRNDAAELHVGRRAIDEHAIEGVAQRRAVIGAQADEIGLNRRVVGVGDVQAVAAVAVDHVVEHERILLERAADQ